MSNPQKFIRKKKLPTFNNPSYNNHNQLINLLVRECDSLHPHEKDFINKSYKNLGREFVEKMAADNQITPFAAHILSSLDHDTEYWKKKHTQFILRNTAIKSLIDTVFVAFKQYNCSSVTLTENFAVVLSTNSCIGCFCSGDVDLSADIAEQKLITECLNSIGFNSNDQPRLIGEYSGQSMQFFNKNVLKKGFWINVIWKPVTRAFLVQDKYEKRLSVDRLNAVLVPGTSIRVLDDDSLMYFCALHISAGHYFTMTPGLRLYIDIDRLARAKTISWKKILEWENQDNAGIRISTTLYLSSKLLKTPIPDAAYKKSFKNFRNRILVQYLIDKKTNQIQNKSSLLRRLYIELASDNRNILVNFFSRFFSFLLIKINTQQTNES